MAEIREETARAGEGERLKMLHEEAAHPRSNSGMDPGDPRRKAIEAEEMRDRTAVEAGEEDYEADMAAKFRHRWEERWSGYFGSFEDTTLIPPMRFTDEPPGPRDFACSYMHTLNVFSVKLAGLHRDLAWPLHVFSIVAARDTLDHNRNIILHRTRDNRQIIHQEDPYLELTGPIRGIVVIDPVKFEVVLKVKGSTESEDKDLSFLVVRYFSNGGESRSLVINKIRTNKLSTLELTFGHIVRSVEAAISVRVIGGSWPDGFRGVFTATTGSINHMKFSLLSSRNCKFPVKSDGMILLSRCVVCVELDGELMVSIMAQHEDEEKVVDQSDDNVFTPKKAGRSHNILKIGSCKMEVTVACSVFSDRILVRDEWVGARHL
ncbi:hypothetical protein VPH35_137961 [Triticum aestivum]|uniref:DUF6598 domain-containing protein n=1 Tax=Triticum aestivum TaxID=4565 RepID=A0A3B6TTD5_WHEAT|nr:uncharacterized protein LOC123169384 [Triticum aestivum]